MIPRILHQCHTKGISALSSDEKKAIRKLKDMNPNWEYKFYDLEMMTDFIKNEYGLRYLDAFQTINPKYGAAQTDYFRYLLVNKVGGVYLDNKSFTIVPLDDIILKSDEFLILSWQDNPRGKYKSNGFHKEINHGSEYQQWNLISKPANKYLEKVIEDVTSSIEHYSIFKNSSGWKSVLKTTGPIIFTNSINSIYDGNGIRFAGNNERNGIIYKDDEDKKPVLPAQHYSKLYTPVVNVGKIQCLMGVVLSFLSRSYRTIKRRILG